jgi:hypothetical protein
MQIDRKELEEIKAKVKEEFPEDPALQQIHIARKIILKEAELAGKSYFEYIKLQIDLLADVKPR